MGKRAKVGDVLELTAPTGTIYAHYLGKHSDYGDAIALCPVVHPRSVPASAELFRDSYVTFYPVNAAVAAGLAKTIGRLPSPGVPTRLRREGMSVGRRVETWIIEDGEREVLRQTLSDDELTLPIVAVWNHEFLINRVLEGWRPEKEGRRE